MSFPEDRGESDENNNVVCDTCHQEYTPSNEPEPRDPVLAEIADRVPDCPYCRQKLIARLGLQQPDESGEAQ